MAQFILPILLFGGMYMLLIRPQQQKLKEQRALVDRAAEGDRIMLATGIYGTITEIVDTAAYIEVAEGIEMLVNRSHIQEILDHFPTEDAPESPADVAIEDDEEE